MHFVHNVELCFASRSPYRSFELHVPFTCKSKVQVIVSSGAREVCSSLFVTRTRDEIVQYEISFHLGGVWYVWNLVYPEFN